MFVWSNAWTSFSSCVSVVVEAFFVVVSLCKHCWFLVASIRTQSVLNLTRKQIVVWCYCASSDFAKPNERTTKRVKNNRPTFLHFEKTFVCVWDMSDVRRRTQSDLIRSRFVLTSNKNEKKKKNDFADSNFDSLHRWENRVAHFHLFVRCSFYRDNIRRVHRAARSNNDFLMKMMRKEKKKNDFKTTEQMLAAHINDRI